MTENAKTDEKDILNEGFKKLMIDSQVFLARIPAEKLKITKDYDQLFQSLKKLNEKTGIVPETVKANRFLILTTLIKSLSKASTN